MRLLSNTIRGLLLLIPCVVTMSGEMASRQERSLEARQSLPRSPPPTDQAFINNALTKQNAIRAKYKAPALTWNPTLATAALAKSNSCHVNHTVSPT